MRQLLPLAPMPIAESLMQAVAAADALTVLPVHLLPQLPDTTPV